MCCFGKKYTFFIHYLYINIHSLYILYTLIFLTKLCFKHHQFSLVKYVFGGLENFLTLLPAVKSHSWSPCTFLALLHLALSPVVQYLFHTVCRSTWQAELSEGCTGVSRSCQKCVACICVSLTCGMNFERMQSNLVMSLCLQFQSSDSQVHKKERQVHAKNRAHVTQGECDLEVSIAQSTRERQP